jgi:hypothetical protein
MYAILVICVVAASAAPSGRLLKNNIDKDAVENKTDADSGQMNKTDCNLNKELVLGLRQPGEGDYGVIIDRMMLAKRDTITGAGAEEVENKVEKRSSDKKPMCPPLKFIYDRKKLEEMLFHRGDEWKHCQEMIVFYTMAEEGKKGFDPTTLTEHRMVLPREVRIVCLEET